MSVPESVLDRDLRRLRSLGLLREEGDEDPIEKDIRLLRERGILSPERAPQSVTAPEIQEAPRLEQFDASTAFGDPLTNAVDTTLGGIVGLIRGGTEQAVGGAGQIGITGLALGEVQNLARIARGEPITAGLGEFESPTFPTAEEVQEARTRRVFEGLTAEELLADSAAASRFVRATSNTPALETFEDISRTGKQRSDAVPRVFSDPGEDASTLARTPFLLETGARSLVEQVVPIALSTVSGGAGLAGQLAFQPGLRVSGDTVSGERNLFDSVSRAERLAPVDAALEQLGVAPLLRSLRRIPEEDIADEITKTGSQRFFENILSEAPTEFAQNAAEQAHDIFIDKTREGFSLKEAIEEGIAGVGGGVISGSVAAAAQPARNQQAEDAIVARIQAQNDVLNLVGRVDEAATTAAEVDQRAAANAIDFSNDRTPSSSPVEQSAGTPIDFSTISAEAAQPVGTIPVEVPPPQAATSEPAPVTPSAAPDAAVAERAAASGLQQPEATTQQAAPEPTAPVQKKTSAVREAQNQAFALARAENPNATKEQLAIAVREKLANDPARSDDAGGKSPKAAAAPSLQEALSKIADVNKRGLFSGTTESVNVTPVSGATSDTAQGVDAKTREFARDLLRTRDGREVARGILRNNILIAESQGSVKLDDLRAAENEVKKSGNKFVAKGVFTGDSLILFRDNLTKEDVASVAAHEVKHFFDSLGDTAKLSKGLQSLLGEANTTKLVANVKSLADSGNAVASRALQAATKNVEARNLPPKVAESILDQEIVAHALEEAKKSRDSGGILGRAGRILPDALSQVKSGLRRVGADLNFSENDLSIVARNLVREFNTFRPENQLDGTLPTSSSGKPLLFSVVGPTHKLFESFRQAGRTFTGPDSLPRAELDTKGAKLFKGVDDELGFGTAINAGANIPLENLDAFNKAEARHGSNRTLPLSEVLNFPALLSGYAGTTLPGTPVTFAKIPQQPGDSRFRTKGFYDPESQSIVIDESLRGGDALDVILHEVQHAIQHLEGFTPGTSVEALLDTDASNKIEAAKTKRAQEVRAFSAAFFKLPKSVRDDFSEELSRISGIDNNGLGVTTSMVDRVARFLASDFSDSVESAAFAEATRNMLDSSPHGKLFAAAVQTRTVENSIMDRAYQQYLRVLGEVESRAVTDRAARRRAGENVPVARSSEEFFDQADVPLDEITVPQQNSSSAASTPPAAAPAPRPRSVRPGLGKLAASPAKFSATSTASEVGNEVTSDLQPSVPDLRHPSNGSFNFNGFTLPLPFLGKGNAAGSAVKLSRRIVSLLMPNKGVPSSLLAAVEELQGRGAAAALQAVTSINDFNVTAAEETKALGARPGEILDRISKMEHAVGQRTGDDRTRLRAELLSKIQRDFPESAAKYQELRRKIFSNSSTILIDMLESGRTLTDAEQKIVKSVHENLGEFMTRTFKLFQGSKVRRAHIDFLKASPEGRKIVSTAENFILANDILIPEFTTLNKLPESKLRSLYDLWVDNKGNNPKKLTKDQLVAELEGAREGVSGKKAKEEARRVVEELLNVREASNTIAGKIAAFYRRGQVDQTIVTARKGVPKEIRELLGEVTNPLANVFQTLLKQGEFIARSQALSDVSAQFRGEFFFEKKSDIPQAATAVQLQGPEWGALQNLWTTSEVADLFTTHRTAEVTLSDVFDGLMSGTPEGMVPTAQAILNSAAWLGRGLKFATVVASPMAVAYNFLGSPLQMVMNGNFLFEGGGQSMKTVFMDLNGAAFKTETPDAIAELIIRKLADNSLVGEISRAEFDQVLEFSGVGNELGGWREVKSRWTDLFSAADLYAKVANFKREVRVLTEFHEAVGSNLTEEQIRSMAGERIRRTNFTFDRAFRITRTLEKSGVTNFLTYMGEVFRTTHGNITLGVQDIAAATRMQDGPAKSMLLKHGTQRVAGALAATAGHKVIHGLYASALGGAFKLVAGAAGAIASALSDEDEEKIKKGLSDSEQIKTLVPFSKEGSIVKFFDVGRVDPLGPLNEILGAIMEGDMERAQEATTGMLIWNIGAQRLIEAVTGLTDENPKPANSSFKFRYPDAEAFLVEVAQEELGLSPATTTRLIKAAESLVFDPIKSTIGTLVARDRTPEEVLKMLGEPETLLRMLGMRTIDFDAAKDTPRVLGFEYRRRVGQSRSRLIEALRGADEPSEATLTAVIQEGIQREFEGYTRARDVVVAARTAGLSSSSIRTLASKDAGLNETQINNIFTGKFKPTFITLDSLRQALRTDILESAKDNVGNPQATQEARAKLVAKYQLAIGKMRKILSEETFQDLGE